MPNTLLCKRRTARAFCAVVAGLCAAGVSVADSASPFPIKATSDGITVTITGASWETPPGGKRGLAVTYNVTSGAGAPFAADTADTVCLFEDPKGANIGYLPFGKPGAIGTTSPADAAVYNPLVSPNWTAAHLRFRVSDPKATFAQRRPLVDTDLTWRAVPVPDRPRILTRVGTAQTTAHGTKIVLRAVTLEQTQGGQSLLISFGSIAAPGIDGLRVDMGAMKSLKDAAGREYVMEDRPLNPAHTDQLTGLGDGATYTIPLPSDTAKVGPIDVTVSVRERANGLVDPAHCRYIMADVPLAGVPKPAADGPEPEVTSTALGGLSLSLESFAVNAKQQYHMTFWLKSPTDKVVYQARHFEMSTEDGKALPTQGATIMPAFTSWKASGASAGPNEFGTDYSFTLPDKTFAPEVKTISIAVTAYADSQDTHRYRIASIPVPRPGETLKLGGPQAPRPATDPLVDAAGPMRITAIGSPGVPGMALPADAPATIWLRYAFTGAGASGNVTSRHVTLTDLRDDAGNELIPRIQHATDPTDTANGEVQFALPVTGVKALQAEFSVQETVQQGPPVTLTLQHVPVPVLASATAPAPAPPTR